MKFFNLITPAGSSPQLPPSIRTSQTHSAKAQEDTEPKLPKGPYRCTFSDRLRGQGLLKIRIQGDDGKRIEITSSPENKKPVTLEKSLDGEKVYVLLNYEKAMSLIENGKVTINKDSTPEHIQKMFDNLMKTDDSQLEKPNSVPVDPKNNKTHEEQIKNDIKVIVTDLHKSEKIDYKNLKKIIDKPSNVKANQKIDKTNLVELPELVNGKKVFIFQDASTGSQKPKIQKTESNVPKINFNDAWGNENINLNLPPVDRKELKIDEKTKIFYERNEKDLKMGTEQKIDFTDKE